MRTLPRWCITMRGNVLVVRGEKDKPIAIPAGQWRLLGYTIDLTDLPNAKTEQSERKPAAGGAVVVNPECAGRPGGRRGDGKCASVDIG